MSPTSKQLLTRGILGAILVFFLMPFVTLSCGGTKLITMNGVNMAMGSSIEEKDAFTGRKKTKDLKAEPLAALAALAAIAALGLAFVSAKKKTGSMIASGACALLLLLMKFKVDGDVTKQGEGMVLAQWEFGFWLALLGSLAVTALFFLPEKEERSVVNQGSDPGPAN